MTDIVDINAGEHRIALKSGDDLRAARGIGLAVLWSAPIWIAFGLAIHFWI